MRVVAKAVEEALEQMKSAFSTGEEISFKLSQSLGHEIYAPVQRACGGRNWITLPAVSPVLLQSSHQVRMVSTDRYWNLEEGLCRKTIEGADVTVIDPE